MGPVRGRRGPRQRRGWAVRTAAAILRPSLTVLIRRRWIDGHKIPATGGCVLAANHVSHLDPLTFSHFVYAQGRVPRFLAKASLFDIPGVRRLLRDAGQIPVYRLTADAQAALEPAVAAVEAGEALVVYPEGTLTRQPEMWPMRGKTGAARVALTAGVAVVPIAQWGAQDILFPYARWPHLLPRKTVWCKAGDPVDLEEFRGVPLTPTVLHEATERIMGAITALLADIRQEEPPAGERFDPRKRGIAEIGNPRAQARQAARRTRGRR